MRFAPWVVVLLCACTVPKPTFECGDWIDCGPGGACEPGTNACSVADASCLSGRRFSELSKAPFADACVEQKVHPARSEVCRLSADCLDLRDCVGGRCVSVVAISTSAVLSCAECAAPPGQGFPFCWGPSTVLPVIDPPVYTYLTLIGCRETPQINCKPPCDTCGANCTQFCFGTERINSISVGDNYACWDNTRTFCIGENTTSQIGVPATAPGLAAVFEATTSYDLLATGSRHTCGRDSFMTSKIDCWGATDHGQLGVGQAPQAGSSPIPVRSDPFPPSPSINAVTDLAVSDTFTCATSNGNSVHCWGEPPWGAGLVDGLGDGPVTAMDVGAGHACVVKGGRAMCWGANDHGQSAPRSSAAMVTPTQVMPGTTFVTVVTGRNHSCGVSSIGTIHCWGASDLEQLGPEAAGPGPAIVDLPFAVGVIEAGEDGTCAITADDRVHCWGNVVQGEENYEDFQICQRDLPDPP